MVTTTLWAAAVCLATTLWMVQSGDAFTELGRGAWKCAFDSAMNLLDASEESSSSSEEGYARYGSSTPCECVPLEVHAFVRIKMDCSRRGFTSIADGAMFPYRIHVLDLSNNRIAVLKKGIFDSSSELVELILRNNGLTSIQQGVFDKMVNLVRLDLGGNFLEELPDGVFASLNLLRKLDLSWNMFRLLSPNVFSNITHLDTLSLNGNAGIGSYLHEDPSAVKDILRRGLLSLKLNSTNLTDIPENLFNEAKDLQELDVANNFFVKLPHLWIGSLQVLNISGSKIKVLETGGFLSLPNLRVLRLDHSHDLQEVQDGAFVSLKNLHVLTLERCYNLTSFSGLAFGGPSSPAPQLHVFNLKHGGLETLSKKLLPLLANVEKLHLQGNPWNCDCRLKWVKNLTSSKENDAHLMCYSPSYLHNRTLSSVEGSEFTCMTKQGRLMYGLLLSMAVVFTIIALLMILAYCDILRRRRSRTMMVGNRVRYDPMMAQLNPALVDNYWEDGDGDTSTISFVRGNRIL